MRTNRPVPEATSPLAPLRRRQRGGHSILEVRLKARGWCEPARIALQKLIREGRGLGLPVVFDFDNTLVGGDIGEAVLAVLARNRVLTPKCVDRSFCPPFRTRERGLVRMERCVDITEYYEALLSSTVHGANDEQPLANGYAWAAQIMQGLRLEQVIQATRTAAEWSDSFPGKIEVTPGRTAYPAPFFYAPMVELAAELLQAKFEPWIVSASNVWSVRWMVLNVLNPLLRQQGVRDGIRADHVVGVSMLLADGKDRLYKDVVLVRDDINYARLQRPALCRFTLTSQLSYPVPAYSGKIAAIFDRLGRNPYLVAGDSPGDLPMMSIGRHRLWIARQNKRAYQQIASQWFRKTKGDWIVQPTDGW